MTTKEEHAIQIATKAHDLIYEKYLKGASKHGGNIQRKLMIPHALEEAVDQMVYLLTLKEQWQDMVDLVLDIREDLEHGGNIHNKVVSLANILIMGNPEGIIEEELEK